MGEPEVGLSRPEASQQKLHLQRAHDHWSTFSRLRPPSAHASGGKPHQLLSYRHVRAAPFPTTRRARTSNQRCRKWLAPEGSHFPPTNSLASGVHKEFQHFGRASPNGLPFLSTPNQTHPRESPCRRSPRPRSSGSRPGRFPLPRTRPRSGTTPTMRATPRR